ncbi:HAD family hydrolase [Staphylococcus massiliensis]|uniref:Uncharacterized protein n=1 Tax=Staphylococcus massiliensis S46 TaxID=1229783 RepID=K9AHW5_9STAP|nr:HAD family hydrolase [Staphylococcus massiliensis]EKU45706.1 hypothetical protein C273_10902 [Staphylococcus massiliensis S46]MCG3400215.1 Cof-type HAD-IIB family hydrolase [Staphylococcus massiliensis]MCG3402782.1 Cof-type HAD-IIB family hydrolase [Staphylococcus massiliensis]PNZ96901.1 Cof-type HAD-IIB family hydrolase [Staphylococcus massiliensis CCUG 55927]
MDNVKAIFLDMDGTLLHTENKVSMYTTKTLKTLREHGYYVFIATGRAHNEIANLVPSEFEVDGIISSNGADGRYQDDIVFQHGLNLKQVQKIVDLAQSHDIYYEVFPFNDNRMILNDDKDFVTQLFNQDKPEGVGESEWQSRLYALIHQVNWVDTLPDTTFSKLYMFTPQLDQIDKFRDVIAQQEDLNISISNSSPHNVETMLNGIDKGTGIQTMIKKLNIDQSETLVIGDSDNDRAMFEFGHYTVAMMNAPLHVKALASYETDYDHNEDGAAKFLEKHLL